MRRPAIRRVPAPTVLTIHSIDQQFQHSDISISDISISEHSRRATFG
jgi:hypothetical protein